MGFNEFKDWVLLGLLSGSVYILWQAKEIADKLKNGVNELNIKIAVIIERTDSHEKRIERLEDNNK
jgi:hypothetical protein